MKRWELKISRGFDPRTQKQVGLFAAQLDDQLKRLKESVKEMTVEQLEWQLNPGMNTVGMLLAHLPVAEVFWVNVAANGIPFEPEGDALIEKILGIKDDGIPLPADGVHPAQLKGWTLEQYLKLIDKGRRSVLRDMKKWRDRGLNDVYQIGKKTQATRIAMIYHVLEHFCGHYGQILLLKHLMRDAGIMEKPQKG
ncbi:MAG: DinB family protein [Candidatus Zixiibacteriota bacterium]